MVETKTNNLLIFRLKETKPISDMLNKTYYQPERNGNTPLELWDFQVFKTYEEALNWLWQHDYDADVWNIVEYHEDDIEEPTFIDEYGAEYPRIEDEEDLEGLIIDEVVDNNPGFLIAQNPGETDQDWEDRLWETAHDKVMEAIENIENSSDYNFSSYWDEGDTAWYDEVREDVIRRVCNIITGLEEW